MKYRKTKDTKVSPSLLMLPSESSVVYGLSKLAFRQRKSKDFYPSVDVLLSFIHQAFRRKEGPTLEHWGWSMTGEQLKWGSDRTGSKSHSKKLGKVKRTTWEGRKAIPISRFVLNDTNRRTFQHNMAGNTTCQYETCHTPDVIIGPNFIIKPD